MNSQRLWSGRKLMGFALASVLTVGAFGAARASHVFASNPPASLKLADPNEVNSLMDAVAYQAYIAEQAKEHSA